MQKVSESRLFSEKLKLELYPPFFLMRVKVNTIKNRWRIVNMTLPLNMLSKNPGGVMFGGYQAALADPIAALACSRIFPGYSCWTRAMTIDFKLGGATDLEMRFEFPPELEEDIKKDLAEKGRSTPTFQYGYYLKDGTLCTKISNVVAIRPKGYVGLVEGKGGSPPASADEFSGGKSLDKLEYILKEGVLNHLTSKNQDIGSVWEALVKENQKKDMDEEAFSLMIEKVDVDLTAEERHSLFLLLDSNHDGVISKDEAKKWVEQ